MEMQAEGSLFKGICLLEVREQMLGQDCLHFSRRSEMCWMPNSQ